MRLTEHLDFESKKLEQLKLIQQKVLVLKSLSSAFEVSGGNPNIDLDMTLHEFLDIIIPNNITFVHNSQTQSVASNTPSPNTPTPGMFTPLKSKKEIPSEMTDMEF